MAADSWILEPAEGQQLARAERRPILIWVTGDDPLERCWGSAFGLRADKISGKNVTARWYYPRDGTWREVGVFANTGTREFVAPSQGDHSNWVLVLDDAEKGDPTERPLPIRSSGATQGAKRRE